MPSKVFGNIVAKPLIFLAAFAHFIALIALLVTALTHHSDGDGLVLRHLIHHGAGQRGPRARRLDLYPDRFTSKSQAARLGPFRIKKAAIPINRPAYLSDNLQKFASPVWNLEDVTGPAVDDKETVVNFARMSEDAYKPDPSDSEWMDIGDKFNDSIPFGWEDSGIRGQVFSDSSNSTVILAIKGTTVAVFEGNGTSTRDKENDNLFGSCCCGQGGAYLWHQVCDCQTSTYTCDNSCVKQELRQPNKYFEAVLELYDEVIQLYPTAQIMTVGHSLGGVLASLLGLRHGLPSVTFEAYPQALAATRLGLLGPQSPSSRKNTGGFHFGHSADPIYMGTCNGGSSFCSIAGYAFETTCHTGRKCIYDVVKDWGWRQSTNYHRLRYAIANVYEKYEQAAPCQDEDVNCEDCYLWKFENGTHTKIPSTTSSTEQSTRTRTETCKTPGWWGCRDEATTSEPSTTELITTTTSVCKTPGWFGCKDQTSTTEATTTTSVTTSCTHKGWFGRCLDEETTSTSPAPIPVAHPRSAHVAIQTSA
ncbi:alpha/beta-hydrolase [Aaosphaeria arxii CBS 175.79]|uniref:triacylglycerol lipase n=1 Tax=Aaosphaeria arxii CBS 175.79 TaxID=1450172 RepID=A0A6A5Y9D1_9PLEO|nr:alpha/beta-hydrolase [Aaosphaeria arxii CBS 175.79]KAF2021617.1 alpha/beta-hydrolase [Aaosphaeria arxii CBS 175.79]